jgi:hypothetical protein
MSNGERATTVRYSAITKEIELQNRDSNLRKRSKSFTLNQKVKNAEIAKTLTADLQISKEL